MKALRAILSLDDPLRGLVPLLESKKRSLKNVFGLAFLVFFGLGLLRLLARGDANETAEVLQTIWFVLGGVAMLLLPVILCGYTTFSHGLTPAGGRCRREELLTLPIGRLAIPTQTLLVSIAGVMAWFLGSVAGSLLTFGPEAVWLALTQGKDLATAALFVAPIALTAFTGAVAFTSIGNNNAMLALGFGFLPLVIGLAMPGMGYYGDFLGFVWLWAVPLTLFHLALPFLLYALPPHHWSDTKASRHAVDAVAQLLAYPLIVVTALLGGSWTLTAALLSAAILGLCARQVKPDFKSASGVRVGLGLGLLATLPPLAVCLAVDAYVMNTPVTHDRAHVVRAVPSPDGARIALEVHPAPMPGGLFEDLRMRRVVVVDPSGKLPPRLLAPRFAKIAGWSADGSKLAVHDETIGRFHTDDAPHATNRLGFWRRVEWLLAPRIARTLIYDRDEDVITHDLPRKVVRPGWTTPEQLAHYGVDFRARKLHLQDGTGRTLALDDPARLLIARYGPDGPVLSRPRGLKHELADYRVGLGHLSHEWLRWGANGLVPLEAPAAGWHIARLLDDVEKAKQKAWKESRQERLAAAKAKLKARGKSWKHLSKKQRRRILGKGKLRAVAYRFTRGAQVLDVRDVYQVLEDSCREDAVLAVAPEGVIRIALPGGARTVLVKPTLPGQKLPLVRFQGRYVLELPGRRIVALSDPDWTPRTVATLAAGQQLSALLPDGRVVVRKRGGARGRGVAQVLSPKGEPRPLLPR